AGDGVATATELAAGVQLRQHQLDGGLALHRVDVGRDPASVVHHPHAAVGQQGDLDPVRVAGQGLVDRVVDDLAHQVVQSPFPGRADVHARTLAHRLQALEDGDGV